MALAVLLAIPASAEPLEPYFSVIEELDVSRNYSKQRRHKAFAIGLNNIGWFAFGYESADRARKAALSGCATQVRKKLSIKGETSCKLIMLNDKYVFSTPRPKPLGSNYLPEPDLPLMRAQIAGDLGKSDAILLAVHGCDGRSNFEHPWTKAWINYFTSKGMAFVEPDSFSDPHAIVCGTDVRWSRLDPVFRLRVAQTVRTIAKLKKQFPKKQIFLWGHSEGGNIVQLHNFDVKGIIVTGARCVGSPLAAQRPTLHIFGGADQYSAAFGNSTPVTDEQIKSSCRQFTKKGKYRYVLIQNGDHFVPPTQPLVKEALDHFFRK